jgi:hypothetical protein
MKPLSTTELLAIWEQGMNQSLLSKTLHLLSAACPGLELHAAAELSIGERDSRLLQLRQQLFGTRLANMTQCPQCAERIEWEGDTRELSLLSQPAQRPENANGVFNLEVDDFNITFRLPNSVDIYRALETGAGPAATANLRSSCILDIQRGGEICKKDDLSEMAFQKLDHAMEEADPQADIRMELKCPACSHQWEALFDISRYLWTEIDRWVPQVLEEVHILAANYGWSEQDILNMGPLRRHLYLEKVK